MAAKDDEGMLLLGLALLFMLGFGGEKPEPKGPDGFKDKPDKDKPDLPTPPPPPPPPEDKKLPRPDKWTNDYPTPGNLYVVRSGDSMLKIANKALHMAAYRAAQKYTGATVAEANAFAKEFAGNAQRQYKYVDAITCESWNDATVTTHGYGDQARKSPATGRAIRLLPKHADNLARLGNNKPPKRLMHRGTPGDRANGVKRSGSGSSFETLYLPGVSLKAITSQDKLKLGGGTWPDGSSKRHPPKWVLELGVKDETGSEPKGRKLRGCNPAVKIEVS